MNMNEYMSCGLQNLLFNTTVVLLNSYVFERKNNNSIKEYVTFFISQEIHVLFENLKLWMRTSIGFSSHLCLWLLRGTRKRSWFHGPGAVPRRLPRYESWRRSAGGERSPHPRCSWRWRLYRSQDPWPKPVTGSWYWEQVQVYTYKDKLICTSSGLSLWFSRNNS